MNKKELGKNQSLAREINNKIVLERLKENPLSGTELSFDLSLSNATISSIFNSFLSINLIKKVSSDSTKGAGRKRVKYTINDDFGLVVIVSITGNSLEVVVSSLKNKTLHKVSKAIDKYDLKTIYETIFVIKDILSMKEFRDIRLANIILSLPGLINKKTGEERINEILKQVGLEPDSKKVYRKFSLGMKQKLAIAQAFMEEPKVLLLDEPMNALDEQSVQNMRIMLRRMVRKFLFKKH